MFIKNINSLTKWGEMWGSNPRIPEPQSGVLTTSPIPPLLKIFYQLIAKNARVYYTNCIESSDFYVYIRFLGTKFA